MKIHLRYMIFALVLLATGCSIMIRHKLPSTYDQYRKNPLCKGGQVFLLEIGNLYSQDTVSVYIENKRVLKELYRGCMFPTDTGARRYGGHGEYYYDYLVVWEKNRNAVNVFNMKDPHKRLIKHVVVKDSLSIKVFHNKGDYKELTIPKDNDSIVHILFEAVNDTMRVITSDHILYFM